MAQGDPPVYQLVDANDNVQAEIRHNTADTLIIEQLNGSNIDLKESDIRNAASLGTDVAFLGPVSSTPASADIPTDTTALYYKTGEPETLYQKPDGGTESEVGSTDTRTDVSDNGTQVVTDVEDINFSSNLSVSDDGDGTVTVTASSSDTRTDVSDSGTEVVTDVEDINFADNLDVSDDGDGSVTVDGQAGGTSDPSTQQAYAVEWGLF